MEWEKALELSIAAVAALVASYAGAFFAFDWNRDREDKRLLDARVEACNKALYILSEQLRTLINYRDQYVNPYRDHEGRHFLMSATLPVETKHLHLDSTSLAFLFETSAIEVPPLLAIENARFHSTITAINTRSKFHELEYQVALNAAMKDHGEVIAGPVLERALGPRITHTMRRGTEDVIKGVDDTITTLTEAGQTVPQRMRAALRVEKRIIKFQVDDQPVVG